MIDWTKPIETVDGRAARLIETNATEPGIWHIVYVSSIADPYGFGDVFIVNNEGYLCDDRTMGRKYSQEPIIRNVRVKREGWVVKYKDQDRLWDYRIFSSEEIAIGNSPVQTVVVRMQWEE